MVDTTRMKRMTSNDSSYSKVTTSEYSKSIQCSNCIIRTRRVKTTVVAQEGAQYELIKFNNIYKKISHELYLAFIPPTKVIAPNLHPPTKLLFLQHFFQILR